MPMNRIPTTVSAAVGAALAVVVSHAFDWSYLLQTALITREAWWPSSSTSKVKEIDRNDEGSEIKPYASSGGINANENEDRRDQVLFFFLSWLLEWVVVSNCVVSTQDLDQNWHMNNGRYSRHADFARSKLLTKLGFLRASIELQCVLVMSAMTIKYRRELRYGERYSIWVRLSGWDERHFYMEHIFCKASSSTTATKAGTATKSAEDRSANITTIQSKKDPIINETKDNWLKQLQVSMEESTRKILEGQTIACVILARMTTTRNPRGELVTPRQFLERISSPLSTKRMRNRWSSVSTSSDTEERIPLLPAVLLPPSEVLDWTKAVETASRRIVARSKL